MLYKFSNLYRYAAAAAARRPLLSVVMTFLETYLEAGLGPVRV
jgi:hypothetical protein